MIYTYLTNRRIVTNDAGIIIESNVRIHPVGEKVDPKWLKAVGWKVKK